MGIKETELDILFIEEQQLYNVKRIRLNKICKKKWKHKLKQLIKIK
jgi:hypothetical protein